MERSSTFLFILFSDGLRQVYSISKAVAPLRSIRYKHPNVDPDALAQLFYEPAFNENALRQRFQAVCAMLSEDAPLSTTTSAQCRQPKNMWEEQVEQSITKK